MIFMKKGGTCHLCLPLILSSLFCPFPPSLTSSHQHTHTHTSPFLQPAVQLHDWGKSSLYLGTFCIFSSLTMGVFAAVYGGITHRLGMKMEKLDFGLKVSDTYTHREGGRRRRGGFSYTYNHSLTHTHIHKHTYIGL